LDEAIALLTQETFDPIHDDVDHAWRSWKSGPQRYALVRFELARTNSQKAFSSSVPAASSRMACAAVSSLAVKRLVVLNR
jgi:hypothetical protein